MMAEDQTREDRTHGKKSRSDAGASDIMMMMIMIKEHARMRMIIRMISGYWRWPAPLTFASLYKIFLFI